MPPDLAVPAHGGPVQETIEGLEKLHLCRLKVFGLPGQPDPRRGSPLVPMRSPACLTWGPTLLKALDFIGEPAGVRSRDPLIKSQMLYR